MKQRLYDEKKITDGVLPARQQCVSKPLGRVQQSAQHRKQQSHVADVLQKRAAATKAEETIATKVAEQAAATKAEGEEVGIGAAISVGENATVAVVKP